MNHQMVMRRRLLHAALADFTLIVDGVEYKPGDRVTILSTTTVTVKGKGTLRVTLIGGGGGGADYVSDVDNENYFSGGSGGDGGMSVFTAELKAGSYAVTIGYGGTGGIYGNGTSGGTTSAFNHSAGGGGGGYAASEYGDGTNGAAGVGETANGNTTQYGQGGSGTHRTGGDAGGSGACIIKIIDPSITECTITMSGTFDASYSYVTIDGEKAYTAGQYIVPLGSVITLATKNVSSNTRNKITVNGATVAAPTTTALATYDYTVESDCTITGTKTGISSYWITYTLALVSAE